MATMNIDTRACALSFTDDAGETITVFTSTIDQNKLEAIEMIMDQIKFERGRALQIVKAVRRTVEDDII